MKIRIGDKMGAQDLRFSASISLGIHLFFILITPVLFSSADVRRPPIRYVRVIVHPLEEEKKIISEETSPLPVNNPIQSPKQKDFKQEQRQKETILKKEFEPPKPFPVQAEVRMIPVEESTLIVSSREDEKTTEAPETPVMVASLNTDLIPKKEEDPVLLRESPSKGENLSAPLTPSLQGALQGESLSGSASGEGPGMGQEGSGGSGSGNGPGTGKGGFHWSGIGEGTGVGQEGSRRGGSGNGPGAGTGFGDGDLRGGGSRKGGGILSKLFSSSGGATGGYPRYAENPKPSYPQEARERGYQGEVLLRVEVLSNGRVGQIEVKRSSGHDILDQSALSTVKQWKFIPAKKGESTLSLWVNVPIKFQLQ